MEGTGNSFTYVHPDCESGARLVWDWDATYVTTRCYVSKAETATPTYPYDSWATATPDLAVALAMDVDEIVMDEDTFPLSSTVTLDRKVTLTGAGKDKTFLDFGKNCRGFVINHDEAVLRKVCVMNCYNEVEANPGIGAYLVKGRIEACRFTGARGKGGTGAYGGGVYQGTHTNAVIRGNSASYGGGAADATLMELCGVNGLDNLTLPIGVFALLNLFLG